MQRPISSDEREAFERDGIICLRKLFARDWIERLRDAAEESLNAPGELHAELAALRQESGRFFHDTFVWLRNDVCREFVYESPAAELAQSCMRTKKVNIFFDQWLIKEPGTETKTPWHHDMTYWPIDGQQIATLWLALDSVSAETGAVQYVKGSHRWNSKYRPASFSGSNQYTEELPEVPDIENMRDDLDIAQFDLEPGDCTLHHGLVVHGSPGNASSDLRRRAYVTRWTGDDVTYSPRDGLQEMPPPPDLEPGDPLDSELWPRILG